MTIVASEGSHVWDGDGNRTAGFLRRWSSPTSATSIRRWCPIAEQAATLCTVAPQHANAARSEAARLIAERTPVI